MKATTTKLLEFLKGPKQFVIPIYQRTYSWNLKQCEQLWKDVLRAGEDPDIKGHFIGSVVYIEKGLYQISAVPQLLVIDGQQRLTTLTLLIDAYGDVVRTRTPDGETKQRKLYNYYLLNPEEDDELRHKLVLTQSDRDTLIHLLEDREPPQESSRRVVENHNYFLEQLSKKDVDLDAVFQGISKLIIVDMALDRDHDNPQLIFESLNSTGLRLSQADLVRNYVLMGLEPKHQEALYNKYWYNMERGFGKSGEAQMFDRFMRDFLTIKTGVIPNLGAVYEAFKTYAQSGKAGTIDDLAADIYRYATSYIRMVAQGDPDLELREIFSDITALKVDVAYPLLLLVYDDYEQNLLTKKELIELLKLVESYVFRRAICGLPTHSLSKTFAGLYKDIKAEAYVESLKAAFGMRNDYRRFPDDAEFERELVIKEIYRFRSRNYFLRKLENLGRKEKVNVEDYTIEHILPQNANLSERWRLQLGENWKDIQNRYLHTLGNLTLTGYNPELSDRPFAEKRDMPGGFADSPLRLNAGLRSLEQWNEEEITKRANSLATIALQVWPAAALDPSVLEKYRKQESSVRKQYDIDDHKKLADPVSRKLFEVFRKHVLNLDASVTEDFRLLYVAYKTTTNFVDVVPKIGRLRLAINLKFDEVYDPQGICEDVTGKGRWGNGDVSIVFHDVAQLDSIMAIVSQSYEKHSETEPAE